MPYSTGVNKALEPHIYSLQLPDEIFGKIANGKVYSQLDLSDSDAYLQVPVDEESSMLLTMNTHCGLFRFNRLPFGVKTAPGAFQQIINAMVTDLTGVAVYLDDIKTSIWKKRRRT